MDDGNQPGPERSDADRGAKRLLAITDAWLNGDAASGMPRLVQGTIQLLIFVNVAALILETVHSIGARYGSVFLAIERVSITVFTIEYVARVLSCVVQERFRGGLLGRLRYVLTPLAIVDLLAIAPGLLPFFGGVDLRSLRAVRLMRVFRLMKVGRYSRALLGLHAAFKSRREELAITGFGTGILLVLASTVLYLTESEAQPDNFGSIPAAAWWGVTTLTTVGYGDAMPVTVAGKVAAGVVAILGVGLFALPAGILGAALIEQVKPRGKCPHCGKEITRAA